MSAKVFLLVMVLILSTLGCKDVVESDVSTEEVATELTLPSIPKRPSEIEVIDLTDEVELFIVVAGAYSSTSSAQKKADILVKAGFSNAEVIQRPGSKLYSALVERFDSEHLAKAFAAKLATNNEIKSYVYKLDD